MKSVSMCTVYLIHIRETYVYPGLSFQNSVTEYVCVSNIQTSNAEDVPTLFTRKKERRNVESVIRPIQRAVHADIRRTHNI